MAVGSRIDDVRADWDVIILGGGMAGLLLARQLEREVGGLRVAVVERTRRPLPASCHKVGESNAELGSAYLERLGLREYLEREHIVKLGLRFFVGGGHLPPEARTEIGPAQEPPVRGYQIDRGRLENDLRRMVEDEGVTLWEGTTVRDVKLEPDGLPHLVVVDRDGERSQHTTRWVVDASGRTGLLRRRLDAERDTRHVGNAGWFRVDEHVHLSEIAEASGGRWHEEPLADQRWRSTTHFMGHGYWVWLIALSTGRTSIGVVTSDAVHGFDRVRTLERTMAFLHEHEPALARRLLRAEVLDFRCIRRYSHCIARSWSADRWAVVGDAGAFVDPLYSPGTDFIALSNSFTVELLRADRANEDLAVLAEALDREYQALVEGSLGVYRQAAPVFAHARAMATKIYWDNFAYWAYTCPYFLQGMFRVRDEAIRQEAVAVRARFVELSSYVQALLHAWASAHPEPPKARFHRSPAFPSMAVDAYLDLQKTMTPQQTLEAMQHRVHLGEQMVAELVVRVLVELGPDEGPRLLMRAGHSSWNLPHDSARAAAEPTIGLARRRAITRVVRDVERALGRPPRHPQWQRALELLRPPTPPA